MIVYLAYKSTNVRVKYSGIYFSEIETVDSSKEDLGKITAGYIQSSKKLSDFDINLTSYKITKWHKQAINNNFAFVGMISKQTWYHPSST